MTMHHHTDNDLALLRRFEPVLCFNRGEQFYPMSADLYLTQASLWLHRPDADPEMLAPPGKLDDTILTKRRDEIPGSVYYLRVAHAASLAEVRAFRHTSTLREFHTGPGRLVRVGLLARFLDLFFSLSLLLRGNTPGGLAVGAAQRYQTVEQGSGNHRGTWYHGRVVRQHGYIALQYYFFYAFNDWRSSFHGVNDHEGDWEMVTVYVAKDASGQIQPCWMACSAHLGEGDDLRRRWDDPGLERFGEHPIVYVGAGSHANYFFRGEYMPAFEIPFTKPLARAWRRYAACGRALARAIPSARRKHRKASTFRSSTMRVAMGARWSWSAVDMAGVSPSANRGVARAAMGGQLSRPLGSAQWRSCSAARMRPPGRASTVAAESENAGTTPSAGAGWTRHRRQRPRWQRSISNSSDCASSVVSYPRRLTMSPRS